DEHWVALVRAVFEAERQMLPHRRFPLAKLVHLFGKGKPFFETAFNYIHFHIYKTLEKVPDLSVLGWKSPSDQTYFPLTAYFHLDISQMSSELLFFLDVDTGVLDKAQMKRLPDYYLNTLKAMVSAEQTNYHTPKLLSLDERHLLFDTFNPVQHKSDTSHILVHTRFEEQAAQYGGHKSAVTLCDVSDAQEAQTLTYGTLNTRANQLAHYLRQLGVGPNVLVGVCLERSLDLMVVLLGILKAGGAYVPLDPSYPEARLAFMLKDSETSIVVSTSDSQIALSKSEAFKVICLDTDSALINKQSTANLKLEQPVNIEDLAYVIYTSGTTGQPKGVEVPHRALANLLLAMADELAWSSTDGLLAVTTVSFDIAGLELYLPLVTGAQLFIASKEVTLNGEALMQQLNLPSVTTMQATPSTWRLLIRAGWAGRVDFKALCGGEYMPHVLAKDLLNRGCMLWNVYGPTETTIWSLIHRVSTLEDGAIPIGRPIRNTQCYVLDAFKQPVPLGTSGELYISGDGLAHGYRHQKELTEEKFCMWAKEASHTKQRLYRTGDLVRFRPDGLLEYISRVDKQVKVRGFRIELGEIESHLESLDNIEKTIARTWTDEQKDASLVAYIVMKAGKEEYTQSFLRTFLSKKLPMHMLPSAFVTLKELPLMLNGKIDHHALPLPTLTKSSETTYVAPVSALEKQIISIYEEVLSIPHIGIDDNFFDMGGHSLLLVTVHRRLQILLDKKISIVTLFEHATVRKLAAFFDVIPETLDIAVEQRGKRKEWLKKQRKRRTVLEPV
ncbi:MAG: amino acid adenylation domain-containing protein, partial [Gammaproteobacteria bacterium]|nr:amino acid adenylation domain-containing protein [Gammaproteobacteria bacterium]